MVQREYKLLGLRERWMRDYATNFMIDRLIFTTPSLNDQELFEPQFHLFFLENGTLLHAQNGILRLMNDEDDNKIERSKAYLQDLLNGLPLTEL